MGDPEGGPQPCGLLLGQIGHFSRSFTESQSVDDARWERAEQCTEQLLDRIKVTKSSEKKRKDVSDYVGNLIRRCFDCEVYTFGSVPLRTYLPDGDIDLTIVSPDSRLKDTWANAVRSALEKAERLRLGKFRISEIQYINAEVKLIKCNVDNIVVDISFNQSGGLCTLCFLEEVDRVIGKNNFFKRSIILVKAWCYYESAILGAHHGLISTYALEMLVLYIFHVFHNSLRGPLEVLLRFLEFFGKFDWHKYAISVWGPVLLSSLSSSEMKGEFPRRDGKELLLSKEFLDTCLAKYSVASSCQDSNQGRAFTAKYLNVVDPLRRSNNLGRSVNQTNYYRIAKVLGHSADKLLKILLDPSKDIRECFEDKATGFFKRTNDRLDQFGGKRLDADGIREDFPGQVGRMRISGYLSALAVRDVRRYEDGNSSQRVRIDYGSRDFPNKTGGVRGSVCAASSSGGNSLTPELPGPICISSPFRHGKFSSYEAIKNASDSSLGGPILLSGPPVEVLTEHTSVGGIHRPENSEFQTEGKNAASCGEGASSHQSTSCHGCAEVISATRKIQVGDCESRHAYSLGERADAAAELAFAGKLSPNQDISRLSGGMGNRSLYITAGRNSDGQSSTSQCSLPSTQNSASFACHAQLPDMLRNSIDSGHAMHNNPFVPSGPQSVGVNPCLRQVSGSSLGYWTSAYSPVHQCGSLDPSLSPWYVCRPPLPDNFPRGCEYFKINNESYTSYSMQQGESSTLELQRLQPQWEQVQVSDYPLSFDYVRSASHVKTTGFSPQQRFSPENSLAIASTPCTHAVCASPFCVSPIMPASQTQVVPGIHTNSSPSQDGNSVQVASWVKAATEHSRFPEADQVADNRKFAAEQRQRDAESASVHDFSGRLYPFLSVHSGINAGGPLHMSHDLGSMQLGQESVAEYSVANPSSGCGDTISVRRDDSGMRRDDSGMRIVTQSPVGDVEDRRGSRGINCSVLRSDSMLGTASVDSSRSKLDSCGPLTSDFNKHFRNLQHARFCQILHCGSQVTHGKEQYAMPATKVFPDHLAWEGSGRQSISSFSGISYGQRRSQSSAHLNSLTCVRGNLPQLCAGSGGNVEPLTYSYGGTGTFIPTPRPPYLRDRQSAANGRKKNGSPIHEREDLDINQGHGSKLRENGRGPCLCKDHSLEDDLIAATEKTFLDLEGEGKITDKQRMCKRATQHDSGLGGPHPTHASVPITVMPRIDSKPSGQACRYQPIQVSTDAPLHLRPHDEELTLEISHENEDGFMTTIRSSDEGKVPCFIRALDSAHDLSVEVGHDMEWSSTKVEFGSVGLFLFPPSHRDCDRDDSTNGLRATDEVSVNRHDLSRPCLLNGDKGTQDLSSPEQSDISYHFKEGDFPPLISFSCHARHGSSPTHCGTGYAPDQHSSQTGPV